MFLSFQLHILAKLETLTSFTQDNVSTLCKESAQYVKRTQIMINNCSDAHNESEPFELIHPKSHSRLFGRHTMVASTLATRLLYI